MSDRRIQVGDLVQVVRPCPHCGNCEDIGDVFRVSEICMCYGRMDCCGEGAPALCAIDPASDEGLDLRVLKRIPPLDELESTKDTERLKETA